MTNEPALIARQPQYIRDAILRMVPTNTNVEIREWLNRRGIPASYGQVGIFLRSRGHDHKREWVDPAELQCDRLQQYGAAIMAHEYELFTINNIGLRGAIWTMCSRKLVAAGMIESTRGYSPMLFRRLVSREEFRAWLEAQR